VLTLHPRGRAGFRGGSDGGQRVEGVDSRVCALLALRGQASGRAGFRTAELQCTAEGLAFGLLLVVRVWQAELQ